LGDGLGDAAGDALTLASCMTIIIPRESLAGPC
jgi:hypothetical protein